MLNNNNNNYNNYTNSNNNIMYNNNSYNNITEEETETNNKRTRTITTITSKMLLLLLFTISFFCFSSSLFMSYGVESKNCLTKRDGKIVYNVDDKNNGCGLLYNIGDLSKGIGIVNTVDENLETNLTGTPCEFNSDTDSHMESYRDGIVAQNTRILHNSSINISCKVGYNLNNSDKNKVYCSEGTLSYDFNGCYYTGNKGSSLADTLNDYLNDKNYSINDLNISEDMLSSDKDYTVGEPVVIACKEKEGYTLNPDKSSVVMTALGNSQWDTEGECEYQGSSGESLANQLNQYLADKDYTIDNLTPSIDTSKHYAVGDTITLTCQDNKTGYNLSTTNNTITLTASADDNWNISGSCEYTVAGCQPYTTDIANTTVTYSTTATEYGTYNNNTIATVNCASNYYFDGNNDLTCSNGQWTGTVSGTCKTTNGCFIAKSIDTNSITINYYNINYINGSDNDCIVDWGDGTTDSCDQGFSNSHSYSSSKQWTVKICGSSFKGISGTSYSNTNLWIKELISYGNWSQIKSMDYAFYYNENLTKVHSGAFDGLPNVTTFRSTFEYCDSLTSIPAGLFDNNTAVTDFGYIFCNCSSLTSIPAGLFDNNTAVRYFNGTFRGCSSLKYVDIDGENSETVKEQRPLGGTNPITGKTSRWGASGVNMNYAKKNCKVQ